jgi:hypothetical protein
MSGSIGTDKRLETARKHTKIRVMHHAAPHELLTAPLEELHPAQKPGVSFLLCEDTTAFIPLQMTSLGAAISLMCHWKATIVYIKNRGIEGDDILLEINQVMLTTSHA